nr:uncharacterized protein LOC113721800 [Coffea arabica]
MPLLGILSIMHLHRALKKSWGWADLHKKELRCRKGSLRAYVGQECKTRHGVNLSLLKHPLFMALLAEEGILVHASIPRFISEVFICRSSRRGKRSQLANDTVMWYSY